MSRPVHFVFVDCSEDNVRDGVVNGKSPGFRGGGDALTAGGNDPPGMSASGKGGFESQVDVVTVDAGAKNRGGLFVRVGNVVGDNDAVAVDGVVVDARAGSRPLPGKWFKRIFGRRFVAGVAQIGGDDAGVGDGGGVGDFVGGLGVGDSISGVNDE